MLVPCALAFSLLTKIPMPDVAASDAREYGRSAIFYPLVGVVIGLLLLLVAWSLAGLASGVLAALLLLVWVWLTGGLHLDGLADVADAWIGGMGSRDKTLAILKDPRSGPFAIVAVFLLLLLKFTAIQALLLADTTMHWLWLAPLSGRLALLFLLLSTPYIRADGMGAAMAANIPKKMAWAILAVFTLAPLFWFVGAVVPLLAVALFLLLFHYKIKRHPGGITGDFLGAGCELTETIFLLVLNLVPLF